ncbi:tetratricopeptide repeat protein [Pseudaestuariivita rosea]|uniref:tetratricopeptide repeat protein n=1 Tax=Pseudaestuariivita rosea TaxID=2763263 RepID=UPI001ABB16D5|nr:tetratricopeptide repeat protein [Pseudaestuariivita rosea]
MSNLDKLISIRERLWNTSGFFSPSECLAEISELENNCDAKALDHREGAEIAYLRGYIYKRQHKYALSNDGYFKALKYNDKEPFLAADVVLNTRYALVTNYTELGQYAEAIDLIETILANSEPSSSISEDTIAIINGTLAFCLHEVGRFTDALQVNKSVLAVEERLFGSKGYELKKVLTNIAQNYYELHRYDEAPNVLRRALKLSEIHEDKDGINEFLFQLGVVAFEAGRYDEANEYLERALQHAKQTEDPILIERATRNIKTLSEKSCNKSGD